MTDFGEKKRSGTIRILALFAMCLLVGVFWAVTGMMSASSVAAVDRQSLEILVALSAFLSATLLVLSEFPESLGANDVKSRRK